MFRCISWVRRALSHSAALLALATPAAAQVSGPSLLIGPNTSTSSETAHIEGIRNRSFGTGTITHLTVDSNGDVFFDPDVPRKTVAESVTQPWTFTNGLNVGGNLAGQSGTLNVSTPTQISGTTTSFVMNESDAGTNLKNWQLFSDAGKISLRALTDALGSPTELWNGYRTTSTANVFELGSAVGRLGFATTNYTDIGSYTHPAKAIYTRELIADVFTVIEKQVIGNGSFRVGRGTTLTRAIDGTTTTIFTKQKSFRYLDFGILQGLGSSGQPQFEVVRITTSGPADCTGTVSPLPTLCASLDNDDYAYTVERNKDGSSTNSWISGDGISATDRFLDIWAWATAVITGGGAILGDRPLVYFDFNVVSPQPNRAATTGSATISAGASSGGVGLFPGSGSRWFRTSTDGELFSVSIAAINTGTNHAAMLACAMSIELIYDVVSPVAGTFIAPVTKGNTAGLDTTSTFAVLHFGAASGADSGKMQLFGTPAAGGSWVALSPKITPSQTGHHLVFTYNNINGGMAYVDGVATGGVLAPSTPGGCMQVNTHPVATNAKGTTGSVDELAIYARDLSPAEAKAHYEAFLTNRAGLSAGPTVGGFERISDTDWWDVQPRWICGNVVGFYGFLQATYGCGWGDVTATYVTATASDGFSIWSAGTRKFWADTTGNLSLLGNLDIGSGGQFTMGSSPTCVDGVGTGVLLSGGASPALCMQDGTNHLFFTAGGVLSLKSQTFRIDATGGTFMTAKTNSTFSQSNGYNFDSALSGTDPSLWAWETSGTDRRVRIDNFVTQANTPANISLSVSEASTDSATFHLSTGTAAGSGDSYADFIVTSFRVNGNAGTIATLSCSAGQAVKTITVRYGLVTAVTCGAP
jgi:hypothetical protein